MGSNPVGDVLLAQAFNRVLKTVFKGCSVQSEKTSQEGICPLKPVVHLQTRHSLKVVQIVSDHYQLPRQGDSSNLEVSKANRQALPLQIRSNLPVDFCCLPIKRKHPAQSLQRPLQLLDEEGRAMALMRPFEDFCDCN